PKDSAEELERLHDKRQREGLTEAEAQAAAAALLAQRGHDIFGVVSSFGFNAKPRTGSVARFAMDVTSGAAGVDRSAPMRRGRSRTGVENPSQSLAREVRGFDTGDAGVSLVIPSRRMPGPRDLLRMRAFTVCTPERRDGPAR